MRALNVILLPFAALLLAGASSCSAPQQQTCAVDTITYAVAPAVGTADHISVAPGDEQQFSVTSAYVVGPGLQCPEPQVIQAPPVVTWTVSDTINVKISSAQDATNGLATCIGATTAPATVTAIGTPVGGGVSKTLGTATLTCK